MHWYRNVQGGELTKGRNVNKPAWPVVLPVVF